MASCTKVIRLPDLSGVRQENNNKFSSKIVMLALIFFLSLISAIPFIQGETAEQKNGIPREYIRLSELSSAEINKIEVELNKRLLAATSQRLFYEASIQTDSVNLLVERNGWKGLSLNEKADVLSQVATIYKGIIGEYVNNPAGLDHIKTEIHFYDRNSAKKLAFWSEGNGIIME